MSELISVIVPVYNVEEYLVKCIKSLIAQSYPEIEIVIVDDGSTDGSGALCDSFADERVKVIHKENGGLSSARNAGIRASKGRYLCFVDSDDYVDYDYVSCLYEGINKYNADISICRYHIVGENAEDRCELDNEFHLYSGKEALDEMLKDKIRSMAWNKMYKRELFAHACFPEGKVYEDIYIMHKLFLLSGRIVMIPNACYYYVFRRNSIMRTYSVKNTYDNYMALRSRLDDLLPINMGLDGLYAEIVRVRLYFEFVLFKVKWKERIREKDKIRKLKADYLQLNIPQGLSRYLSDNEQLKLKIFNKSKVFYRYVFGLAYEGAVRDFAEFMICQTRGVRNKEKIVINRNHEDAVWILGVPEYNNLGDCAIGYATIQYIEDHFHGFDIFTVTENQIRYHWPEIRDSIKKTDMLVLQGGGNITDIYTQQQKLRHKILTDLPHQRTVIMPSTVYFSQSKKGSKEKEKTRKLFAGCSHLLLLCRESYTDAWVEKNFANVRKLLIPDIAFYLKYPFGQKRNGILFLVRNDVEQSWALDNLQELKRCCLKLSKDIVFSDTVIDHPVSVKNYRLEIFKKLDEIASRELVITDRLHGVIFCAITNTPCISIDNFNYKIKGICRWLQECPFIMYAADIDEFYDRIQSVNLNKGKDAGEDPLAAIREKISGLDQRMKEIYG